MSRAAISEEVEACARAYEALRSHVLAGAASHAGLVVLLRQGVAAWMTRRLACACPAPGAARTTTLSNQMAAELKVENIHSINAALLSVWNPRKGV